MGLAVVVFLLVEWFCAPFSLPIASKHKRSIFVARDWGFPISAESIPLTRCCLAYTVGGKHIVQLHLEVAAKQKDSNRDVQGAQTAMIFVSVRLNGVTAL